MLNRIAWERVALLDHGPEHLRAGVAADQLLLGKHHGRKGGESGVEGGVVDGLRVQLLLKPTLETEMFDLGGFARAGTEGEAIECVEDLLLAVRAGGARRCGRRLRWQRPGDE